MKSNPAYKLMAILFTALVVGIMIQSSSQAASFLEPSTVFYGKVTGTGSAQPFLVTQGTLSWTIRRADGVDVVLTATLFPLNGGVYSYRLDVPHEVLALGLSSSAVTVPVSATISTNINLRVVVNGVDAKLAAPASSAFVAAQVTRAATCRLDIEVPLVALDSDGDGLPDWWETKYGLDIQNGGDAARDLDGDGCSNLQEYLAGTSPVRDGRIPEIVTTSLSAYAGGTSGLRIVSRDLDTPAASLVYSVVAAPAHGTLVLRNALVAGAGSSDQILSVGSVFTQADVDAGKLVYCDPVSDVSVAETRFQVSLRDENLAHAAAQGDIAISLFHPANVPDIADITSSPAAAAPVLPVMNGLSMDEQLKIQFACLSMNLGYIVWDYSSENSAVTGRSPSSGLTKSAYTNQYVPAYGVERRQILWTGYGNDKLSGGMEGDILVAGYGQDTLRGNGGSDLFLLTQISGGNVVIEDFSISDKDLIDLTPLFPAVSGLVTNYVSLAVVGTNTVLGINYSGDGIYFTNRTVTLSGIVLAPSSLGTLLADGYLRVGNLAVCPRVSISATIPSASENGPVAGEFTISRTGSTASDMVVNLQVSGSAANGIDYMLVGSQVVIPAGQVSATIAVTPYVDTASELKEVVQINVVPGAGYEVATASAQVTIDDLAPMISIEALEPLAVKNTLTPGIFLISRSGVLSRSVLVRLAIGGTATIGTDYTSVSAFVNFDVGQATALLTITPKPSGTLANGSESVEITIKPDTSYCVWTPASAKVVIVDELLTAGDWKMRTAAVGAMDLITFLHEDPGAKGYLNIQRYAYGLDPVDPGASSGKPVFTLGGIHPSLTFRRPLSVTDIDYIAEMSRDLKTWQSGPDYFEEFIHPDYTSRLDMVSYRVRQPITNMEPLFMRVRLEYAP